jgi:hypothetical protein
MKIINASANLALWEAGQIFFVGFISGPARMLGGIVQTVINLAAAIFLAIPSIWINPQNKWHISHLMRDCVYGAMHVARGFIETLPLSSYFILSIENPSSNPNNTTNPLAKILNQTVPLNDHPFKRVFKLLP